MCPSTWEDSGIEGSQAGSQNHKWGTRQDSNCHLCHERSRHLPSTAVHLPAKAHGRSADEWRPTPVNRSCQSQWVDGFGDLHRLAEAFFEVHKLLHNQSTRDRAGWPPQPQNSGCSRVCQSTWYRHGHSSSTLHPQDAAPV